jgi:hypothetical protein
MSLKLTYNRSIHYYLQTNKKNNKLNTVFTSHCTLVTLPLARHLVCCPLLTTGRSHYKLKSWALDILAKKLIYTVDIWAIQFQLTLKSMWTIERLSHLPVPTCKVLHKFDAFVEKYSSGEIYLMNSTPLLLGLNSL